MFGTIGDRQRVCLISLTYVKQLVLIARRLNNNYRNRVSSVQKIFYRIVARDLILFTSIIMLHQKISGFTPRDIYLRDDQTVVRKKDKECLK